MAESKPTVVVGGGTIAGVCCTHGGAGENPSSVCRKSHRRRTATRPFGSQNHNSILPLTIDQKQATDSEKKVIH